MFRFVQNIQKVFILKPPNQSPTLRFEIDVCTVCILCIMQEYICISNNVFVFYIIRFRESMKYDYMQYTVYTYLVSMQCVVLQHYNVLVLTVTDILILLTVTDIFITDILILLTANFFFLNITGSDISNLAHIYEMRWNSSFLMFGQSLQISDGMSSDRVSGFVKFQVFDSEV